MIKDLSHLQQSWKQFLYTKCQNLNRKKKVGDDECSAGPSTKRPKLSPLKHPYSAFTAEIEDDTTHERNMSVLKKEMLQVKIRMDVVKDLMRTYGFRRKWIVDGNESVKDVCLALKKAPIVSVSVSGCSKFIFGKGEQW